MESLDFQEIIPLGFWAFSSAVGVMVILLFGFLYLYYRKRLIAVVGDGNNEADVAANVERLRKDEESIRNWLAEQKDELQQIAAERNEQELLRAELQRTEQDCAKNDELNRSLRDEVGGLEQQKYTIAQAFQKLEQDKDKIEEYIAELKNKKVFFDQKIQEYRSDVLEKEKACNKLSELQTQKESQLKDYEVKIRESKNDVDSLEFKRDSLSNLIDSLEGRKHEVELLNKKLLEVDQELKDLKYEVAIQRRLEDEAARKVNNYRREISELERLKNTFDDISKQVEQEKSNLVIKQNELSDVKEKLFEQRQQETATAAKVREHLDEVEKLRTEHLELKTLIGTLEKVAKKYDKQLGGEDEKDGGVNKYRDLWQPVTFPQLKPSKKDSTEQFLLEQTASYIKGQQLYFPKRILHAFHTALKINEISPLVVLAGISGTGKSELPRRYAEGMGMHSVILAVQPRWDSPQDLFGFYNYLEQRYKATDLARAMVQFEQYNQSKWPLPDEWSFDRSDRMLLVLLDEMNLARVEYYFSEFLSRLETRRGVNLNNAEQRASAEISLEMGSLAEGEKHIRLFPGQNVLFTGTMNEDETTQALSDKVLDRSCVLRFGRPKDIMTATNNPALDPTSSGLTHKQWNKFFQQELASEEKDKVTGWINKLNGAMEQLHRPFGYRVGQAIQSYLANYPSWVPDRLNLAMADQIEQRIIPKLRGIEIGDADQPLDLIHQVIKECEDGVLDKAFGKARESEQQVFMWRGLDRAEESST